MAKFSDLVNIKKDQPKPAKSTSGVIKGRFKIQKSDDDKMLAFGWANVAVTASGQQIEDYHDDMIDPEELEQAAYKFVSFTAKAGSSTSAAEWPCSLKAWYSLRKK